MAKRKKEKLNIKQYFSLQYFALLLLVFCTFFGGLSLGFLGNLVKDIPAYNYEEMKDQFDNISTNSEVYFSNGEKVATINYELMRKTVPLSEMGEHVKNAAIASEDSSFYSNMGIDISGILRAAYSEVTGASNTGGSTITQQLVKNQLLDSSRSYERKAKEILLSIRVNNYFSKNDILEAYLNMATFGKNKLGQNISGIETAALGVFGISSKDLNIAQSAYLIGFVQSPFKYTPFDVYGNIRSDEELQAGFDRQKYVLERMLSVGYITEEEYDEALNFDIKDSFIESMNNDSEQYPYIVNEVISSAAEILAEKVAKENDELEKFKTDYEYRNSLIEKSRVEFVTGGYKVNTTINKELYNTLEDAKDNYTGFISQYVDGELTPIQLGATVIENDTGRILAFIGGRDFSSQQLNHANRTYRSPGSTIKPLLVYAPAIQKGYITPNSQVLDRRFDYNGWRPENFAKVEYGVIPAKYALAQSLNLSTIRLYSAFVNENPMQEFLDKMNFKALTKTDHETLSASIGGLSYGVTVTENTNAFATFANGGVFKQAHLIDEIIDSNNKSIYKANFEPVKVYSEETSFLTLKMLNDVLSPSGNANDIANSLPFSKENMFLKTGTSEFNHDLWSVGGTKNITFGLWTGFDKPTEIKGYVHAHNQWSYFMNVIYNFDSELVKPNSSFTQPSGVQYMSINPYDNGPGEVVDLVPKDFKQLDENKTLKKLGSMLDKTILTYLQELKEKSEEDDEENSDENSDENSSEERSSSSSRTSSSSNSNSSSSSTSSSSASRSSSSSSSSRTNSNNNP